MSTFNNREFTNFSPPLPPKLRQTAPPIPPKLNIKNAEKEKVKNISNILLQESPEQKSKIIPPALKPRHNLIIQNESYRLVVHQQIEDIDYKKKDSDFIYENRNIILKDSINEELIRKPKSLITRMKNLFTKKHSKKPIAHQNNEYFSSHKSEGSILPARNSHFNEISEDSCTCSELNKSWYKETQCNCCCSREFNNIRFHVFKPHCHFNSIPLCQINNSCRCNQQDHLTRINSQFHNISNINRCIDCQRYTFNTHCTSQFSSFSHDTSFSVCSKVAESNHDQRSPDNRLVNRIELNTDNLDIQPLTNISNNRIVAQGTNPLTMSLHENLQLLRKIGWYWGPLKSDEVEEIMENRCDGTFIVRDSSHADHLFSITFRVNNFTHHTRISFSQEKFWLSEDEKSDGYKTVANLINATILESQIGQFRYFRNIDDATLPNFPVILLYPLSRFRVMTSLKHIARFVIVSQVRSDHLDQLPLPEYLVSYLQDKDHHYVENFFNYVNIMKVID